MYCYTILPAYMIALSRHFHIIYMFLTTLFMYCLKITHISTRHLSTFIQMWYPCGSFKGDEKSAALCQNYADNGLLSSISKNQLDSGVGGSLYRDLARLEETIVRGYPQLRKEKGNLEFGYKLSFGGLSKEQEKIQVVDVKEQKGFFDGLKNVFGGN